MPTYFGYVPRGAATQVDYASLTAELGEKIDYAIGTRDRERAEYLRQADETQKMIQAQEDVTNQSLQDVSLKAIDSGREMIYAWKKQADAGEMTPAEYKRRLQNLSDSFTSFNNSVSTFDKRVMETMQRQQPGEDGKIAGSGKELELNKRFSELADLKNVELYINPNSGNTHVLRRDVDGNVIDHRDVRSFLNPGAIVDNRVYVNDAIKPFIENWKDVTSFDYKGRGASVKFTDPRMHGEYVRSKQAVKKAVLSSDNSLTSVLTDNGAMSYSYYETMNEDGVGVTHIGEMPYQFYYNDEDKQLKIDNAVVELKEQYEELGSKMDEAAVRKELEDIMILLQPDEVGVYQPVPTDRQRKAGGWVVDDMIEMDLGKEKSYTRGFAPTSGDVKSGGTSKEGGAMFIKKLVEAWNLSEQDPRQSAAILSAHTGDRNIRFEWRGGGLQPVRTVQREIEVKDEYSGEMVGTGQYRTVTEEVGGPIKNLMDMSSYFYGETEAKGQGSAYEQMKKDRSEAIKRWGNPETWTRDPLKREEESTPTEDDPLGIN